MTKKEPPEAVLEPRPPQEDPKLQNLDDKMSKLNTNDNSDTDDRPLPPEDDSVPDMPDEVEDLNEDETAPAVVDLDEDLEAEQLGNDDL